MKTPYFNQWKLGNLFHTHLNEGEGVKESRPPWLKEVHNEFAGENSTCMNHDIIWMDPLIAVHLPRSKSSSHIAPQRWRCIITVITWVYYFMNRFFSSNFCHVAPNFCFQSLDLNVNSSLLSIHFKYGTQYVSYKYILISIFSLF